MATRSTTRLLFDEGSPASMLLVRDLERLNPWWQGAPLPVLPPTRRHLVDQIRRRMTTRLAPITVVRGPRQIGKTTAQLQIIDDLLHEGVPPSHILRVQFDDLPEISRFGEPILQVVDWFERNKLRRTLNAVAREGGRTFLLFDEVQNLEAWAPQLKSLVDHSTTTVVVTGSSALRIELGRDSLSGRITTIEAGVLSLTEIAAIRGIDLGAPFLADNGLEPLARQEFWKSLRSHGQELAESRDAVFRSFSERGGYPVAHRQPEVAWDQVAGQLNENVIRKVIQHDLRVGESGRKRDAVLLEAMFRMCCRYVGQAPNMATFTQEARQTAVANVGEQRCRHYLQFLGDTLLLRLIQPLEIRLKKRRSNPKICLADHGLRQSWLQEVIPLAPDELAKEPQLTALAGRVAESVVGAALSSISHLDIAYVPARGEEPEVDFLLTLGTHRVPIEVKYQRKIDPLRDTEGLRTFLEKKANNAPFGILITQTDEASVVDPRVVALPLSTFLLLR